MSTCPWCKGAGVWVDKRDFWKEPDFRNMLEDRKTMTLDKMAAKYGVSYQRMQQLLKKARGVLECDGD